MSESSSPNQVSSRTRTAPRIDSTRKIVVADPSAIARPLPEATRKAIRVPYGLRHVEAARLETLLPVSATPEVGQIVLAQIDKIGKNTRLELANGRPCTLYVGDLVAVVFGNRYATAQFEGYARANGAACDLLSMGGLCGLEASRHASIPESSKLRLLGALGDREGRPLTLRSFALPPPPRAPRELKVAVVCGSSMDSGKTHTASSVIAGLRKVTKGVAGIKLTGTAAGRDTWSMLDAGACAALDFVDGGHPSTYLLGLEELLGLHEHLLGHAAQRGASWAVVEIADGLLQAETAALIRSPEFVATVDAWFFAAGDPLAALSGVDLLRSCGIDPVGITGRITMSPLAMREAAAATKLPCFTAAELQAGAVNGHLTAESENEERSLSAGVA